MTESATLHTDFISQKGSTSVSSNEVNMAEATPITEESTINRSSSHQIGHTYRLQSFICKTNDSSTSGEATYQGLHGALRRKVARIRSSSHKRVILLSPLVR